MVVSSTGLLFWCRLDLPVCRFVIDWCGFLDFGCMVVGCGLVVWLLCFSVLLVVTLVAGFGWVGFLVCGGFGVICVWVVCGFHGFGRIWFCMGFWFVFLGGGVGSSMVLFFWVLVVAGGLGELLLVWQANLVSGLVIA